MGGKIRKLSFWISLFVFLIIWSSIVLGADSYIIVHAVNPEGVEIGGIGISPYNHVNFQIGVEIYDGDNPIGHGIYNGEGCNNTIIISPGDHTIKAVFNGITLEKEINIKPNEIQILTFVFKRTEYPISSLVIWGSWHDIPVNIPPQNFEYWYVQLQQTSLPIGGFDCTFRHDTEEEGTLWTKLRSYPGTGTYIMQMRAYDSMNLFRYFTGHLIATDNPDWWAALTIHTFKMSSVPYDLLGTGVRCEAVKLPVASFAYSPEPLVNQGVTFDASSSYDPDGQIVKYGWDFGDGESAEGMQTNHAYNQPGEYTVTLTVLDENGLPGSLSKGIVVKNPPNASFTYSPVNPLKKEKIAFDASSSHDPDGTIVRYEWDFGDGNTTEGIQANHAYAEAGEYEVTLTVMDNDGLKHSLSKNIKVEELCIPLQIKGPEYKKIDIVFISDSSYNNEDDFLNDVWNKINGAYGDISPIKENLDMFNFYYVNITNHANIGNQFYLPHDFFKLCYYTDSVAILHKNEMGDWTNRLLPIPTIFSAEGYETKAFLHESGHAVFGLLDEYDDAPKCDTKYTYPIEPYSNPNIWKTENDCRDYATASGGTGEWDPDKCRKFTDCQGDWWKIDIGNIEDYGSYDKDGTYRSADPDPYPDDIMTWGNKVDGFGVSSRNRISWYFNSVNSAPKPHGYPKTTKSIIAELEMKDSIIMEIRSEAIYGEHPNYFDFSGAEFNINFYSNESLLKSYGMSDPRIIIVEYGSNMSPYIEDVNFTLVLPYIENLSMVEIVNLTSILFSLNISEKIEELCSQKNGICDEDCKEYYDPDCSIFLQTGWNLISVPFNVSNKTAEWLCEQVNCSLIFAFQDGTWRYYDPAKPVNTLDSFDEKMGLWIKVNKSIELSLEGYPFENAEISLSEGWNLAGYPFLYSSLVNETSFANSSSVYSYKNGEWNSYVKGREDSLNTLKSLAPGYGYWVKGS